MGAGGGNAGAWLPCRLIPLNGSSPAQRVGPANGGCTFAAWSPDGEWMYFSSDSGGAFHTWRQRFPDGQPEQITSGPTEEEGLAMAPDGRSFITSVGMKQSSVKIHDASGDRQISVEGFATQPKFTPDGKGLVYRLQKGPSRPGELWMAQLDSRRNEPLLPGFPILDVQAYDISPDGRQVLVQTGDIEGKLRLWLAPLDRRSPPRQIPGVEGDYPAFGARTAKSSSAGEGAVIASPTAFARTEQDCANSSIKLWVLSEPSPRTVNGWWFPSAGRTPSWLSRSAAVRPSPFPVSFA